MSSKSFDDYKRDCEQMLEDIRSYSYKNTDSKDDTHALNALQQTCSDCRLHSLIRLNESHKLFTGNTSDILRNFKEAIETAQRVFKSVVGDAQYEYTEGPHAWYDGPEKTLIPGVKNEMLGYVSLKSKLKIHSCLFYIQYMIDIKSEGERATTQSTNVDGKQTLEMFLHRLQSYSFLL